MTANSRKSIAKMLYRSRSAWFCSLLNSGAALKSGAAAPARFLAAGLIVAFLGLTGCASTKQPTSPAIDESSNAANDPFESVNRKIWAFDITADKYVLRPVAVAYRDNIPPVVRSSVSNVLRNMKQPLFMANDVMQLNPDHLLTAFARFITNSIFGIGGLIDVATDLKIPYHESDFGQTMGRWGVPAGPYLVLPLLGPSDPRDAVGYGVESFTDPVDFEFRMAGYNYIGYSRTALGLLDNRSNHIDDLDQLRLTSLDFYAAARSLYQQQRAAAVANAAFHPRDGGAPQGNGTDGGAVSPTNPRINSTTGSAGSAEVGGPAPVPATSSPTP